MNFFNRLKSGVIVFDGAMGTQIHAIHPTPEEWDGKLGCSEVLNLTAPQKIKNIHQQYLVAGADVIETNTFGANNFVLQEYDLSHRTEEINRVAAQIARSAVDEFSSEEPRYVAGSIGPGTKLISLRQTNFDTMYASYADQIRGLLAGGVDLLVIETCQDPLQIKTCLLAAYDSMKQAQHRIPVLVSVTVENTGTLLVGTEVGAVLAALEPYDIQALGMNCATGPDHMRPFIKQICRRFNGPVLCLPNAGLPQNVAGEMVYTLPIQEFVHILGEFIEELGVQIVGGCCGTTPDFIRALRAKVDSLKPAQRDIQDGSAVSSLFSPVSLNQDPKPFFVGERANTNGSKLFREYLLKDDWDGVVEVALGQQQTGAHGLDLCVAYVGRNELDDMVNAVQRVVTRVDLPLFVDSTDVNVIEAALKLYGGRAVINSINLEDGEARTDRICRLAKRYGAALIALTIDEKGMAMSVQDKLRVAERLYNIAVNRHGLEPQDIIFDPLTFTLGSGDENLLDAAINTLEGIRAVKNKYPGVYTLLGVSNISFGLSPDSREVLNSVFLAEAVKAGLDLAIVNVKKIMPLYKIPRPDVEKCLNLIYNKGHENPLLDFIHYFKAKEGKKLDVESEQKLSLEEKIKNCVIQGSKPGLDSMLTTALNSYKAVEIINKLLIPAMKEVGELFGSGKMQLPFVLQSAEVMKYAVSRLEPFMDKTDRRNQTSIVLATVRGDVHDIGKNLVDIILSNNGYKVYNLGIKCEIDTMLQKAQEVHADAIGMSGLLVKSTVVMKENLEEMAHRGIQIPVLLGGAALTKNYVEQVCAPVLHQPVVYCADAFDGLNAMHAIRDGLLIKKQPSPTTGPKPVQKPVFPDADETIRRDIDIPVPPFFGDKLVKEINLDDVFNYLTETVLFRGRWGFRRGKLSKSEYDDMVETQVRPLFIKWKQKCKQEKLLVPAVVYGYYACNSDGNDVIVYEPDSEKECIRFFFPRRKKPPFRCIADFFQPLTSGIRDVISLQVVTVGQQAMQEAARLYKSDRYKDYLLFHGLSVETAEALAEMWHLNIRRELNINGMDGSGIDEFVVQKYRGSRYSFGYPACPDLAENRKIFELLNPGRIGVTLTEEDQMVPEQTTSAFIVHHPQAKYFTLE
ncbi:methionine synthase [candidate division KSB1 bacterium]|nr:methionine synthase [candidate division KSB1 bacterium]